jgi:hypothetical protein
MLGKKILAGELRLEERINRLLTKEANAEPWKNIDPNELTNYDVKLLAKLLSERAKRNIEGLALYKPLPVQEEFHRCLLPERLLRGSNRSGKTVGGAVEVARAACGRDPYGKYPLTGGKAYIIGYDGKHISKVMWPKLSRAGAFKIIRDLETGVWRVYNPSNPEDYARAREAKLSPPLIPNRFIKEIAWESKKEGLPKTVKLTTGWELDFFSSLGKPQKGADIDLCWFDEEVETSEWYSEMAARLVDRDGKFLWTATPQAGTEELYRLHERAEEQLGQPYRTTAEFLISLAGNTYITAEQKRQFESKMSEEERLVRIHGEFAFSSFRVFPEFSMEMHCRDWFEIPRSWTRFVAIDPGRQVCAVLFLAVPRPDEGDFAVCYDELYLQACDAETFGERMFQKCQGQIFESFIIDHRGGRVVEMGSGVSVESQYSEALRKRRVSCHTTGSGFTWGSDDPRAGIEAVRQWLKTRSADNPRDQAPKLQIFADKCPNLIEEIKHYRYKRVNRIITDDPESRGRVHQMACFDPITEVLTDCGWKRFAGLDGAERLATVNLDTDALEYQEPTDMVARWHDGDLFMFEGRKIDAAVTPDHRMVVYERDSAKPVIKLAQDLSKWDKLKLTATWEGRHVERVIVPRAGISPEVDLDPYLLAKFLGWYVAEGCRARKIQMPGRGYQVILSQTKPTGVAAISELLGQLPWKWNRSRMGFYSSNKQLWELVGEAGDGAAHKVVPEWIKWAEPEVIDSFLLGYFAGDGWVNGPSGCRRARSISRRLADDIQELAIKSGKNANIYYRPAMAYSILGKTGQASPLFTMAELNYPTAGLRDKNHKPNFEAEPYSGMVYCASVPNGTLVVRRNGRAIVAGNCLRYLAMHRPRWISPRVGKGSLGGAVLAFRSKMDRKKEAAGGSRSVNLGPGE